MGDFIDRFEFLDRFQSKLNNCHCNHGRISKAGQSLFAVTVTGIIPGEQGHQSHHVVTSLAPDK